MNDLEFSPESQPSSRFVWHSFDFRSDLPAAWQSGIVDFVGRYADDRVITPVSVTSRERSASIALPVHFIGGAAASRRFRWLRDMYYGAFREAVQLVSSERVIPARSLDVGINLNMQCGNDERYECHVDACPLTAILYATDHPIGTGGDLMVANRGDVRGREKVDANATRVHPVAGQLIVFDARLYTHYVAPLTDAGGVRIAIAMSYYTPSYPEEMRPADLDSHIGLT
jgi:2OG-Fe(II) oxygenase superfamily